MRADSEQRAEHNHKKAGNQKKEQEADDGLLLKNW